MADQTLRLEKLFIDPAKTVGISSYSNRPKRFFLRLIEDPKTKYQISARFGNKNGCLGTQIYSEIASDRNRAQERYGEILSQILSGNYQIEYPARGRSARLSLIFPTQ